jgi:hypothetical protein
MPHPEKKKQRLHGHHRCTYDEAAVVGDFLARIESLGVDELANIFGFLLPRDIMNARVNRKMREAAKITIVPPTYELVVNSAGNCNAMRVMATALPNLPKITLGYLGDEHKYVDGEGPDEEWAARTVGYTAHDIEFISNFTKLRELKIECGGGTLLNGRYPCFFNFPHLQIFSIGYLDIHIQFDLEMLGGLPSLKELKCAYIDRLTGNLDSLRALKDTLENVAIDSCPNVEGNINSLRVLKNTLETVKIELCPHVMGNFMDLADFPHLEVLHLHDTAVTGDIRDIGENNFPSLKDLTLPKGVYGGMGRAFHRISDAQDVIRIPYLFQKQRPEVVLKYWHAELSRNSPDMYDSLDDIDIDLYAPIYISLVRAGNRVGYRWDTEAQEPCEVNWLDPEPDRESTDYAKYMEELQKIEGQVNYFKGFHQPPTQEEFERILERIQEDEMIDDDSNYDGEM